MKKIIGDMKKNKLWSKTDRISVICCTNKPYDATLKDCKKFFDKQISDVQNADETLALDPPGVDLFGGIGADCTAGGAAARHHR